MTNRPFLTKLLTPLILVVLLAPLLLAQPALANHRSKKSGKNPSLATSLAKNKLSVIATFSNLSNVQSITYDLTYNSNKGLQGAGGTISKPKGAKLGRTLLLGTCSKKVCTYHRNVKDIKLTVDFTLKSGGVVSYEKNIK